MAIERQLEFNFMKEIRDREKTEKVFSEVLGIALGALSGLYILYRLGPEIPQRAEYLRNLLNF